LIPRCRGKYVVIHIYSIKRNDEINGIHGPTQRNPITKSSRHGIVYRNISSTKDKLVNTNFNLDKNVEYAQGDTAISAADRNYQLKDNETRNSICHSSEDINYHASCTPITQINARQPQVSSRTHALFSTTINIRRTNTQEDTTMVSNNNSDDTSA